KARDSREFGDAAEAVTWRKQRRIVRLASEYVMRHHLGNAPCRFDVVSIQFDDGQPVIEVYQNAFSAVGCRPTTYDNDDDACAAQRSRHWPVGHHLDGAAEAAERFPV